MSITKLRGKSALGQHENTQTSRGKSATKITANEKESNENEMQQQEQHEGATTAPSAITVTGPSTPTSAAAAAAATTSSSSSAPKIVTTYTPTTTPNINNNTPTPATVTATHLPQTNLLKIEPFIPSLNTRLRRPISRSYSTLNSTYAVKAELSPTAKRAAAKNGGLMVNAAMEGALSKSIRPAGHFRRHPIKVLSRQRSKSSATNRSRPATAAVATNQSAATNENGILVVPQPNGVSRISRLPKEREKMPDRINYDRRGLTAIPIFEHEPNLRLLSLQHNMINVFHVSKEVVSFKLEPELATTIAIAAIDNSKDGKSVRVEDDTNQGSFGFGSSFGIRSTGVGRQPNVNQGRMNGAVTRLPQNLPSPNGSAHLSPNLRTNVNTHSLTPPPPPPLTMHQIPIGGAAHLNQLLKRNSFVQRNLNLNATHMSPANNNNAHQQQQQQPTFRFALRRSKSFATNYSKHLTSMKRHLQKSILTKTETKMIAKLNGTNLKSFDSGTSGLTTDSTSTLITSEMEQEEDEHMQQLEIKNQQLKPAYGTIFQHLVFLDLYDNQIERICNLDGLPTLSVLLLGKNRITDISGLSSLRGTLRVLDLHGNRISSIGNKINCLRELKSLNLAGNQIRQVSQNDFNGMVNLKELNLKRNKIKRLNGFQHLTALERIWLCHNDLHKVDDMASIAKATQLLEVTIENNPVSLAGDCVSFLVSYLPRLQTLSQMHISTQVRSAAMTWRKNKELSEANYTNLPAELFNSIRREEVISNARTNWELLRSQQNVQATLQEQRSPKTRELAKINESNEAVLDYEELQEFIKLPPIETKQFLEPRNEECHSGSSNSSLGPNVNSSSSCYSSDNEESPQFDTETSPTCRGRATRLPKHRKQLTKTQVKGTNQKQFPTKHGNHENPTNYEAKNGDPSQTVERNACDVATMSSSTNNNNNNSNADTAIALAGGAAGPTQQHLTVMSSNQTSNNSSILSSLNSGHSTYNSTKLPQTDLTKDSMLRPTATTTTFTTITTMPTTMTTTIAIPKFISGQTRATTPTATITANSNTLSLGIQTYNAANNNGSSNNNNNNNNSSQNTTLLTPAHSKRYMQGSLIRSQTVAGCNGVGGRGSHQNSVHNTTINNSNNNNNNNTNSQTGSNSGSGSSTMSVSIVTPSNVILPTTTTSSTNSNKSGHTITGAAITTTATTSSLTLATVNSITSTAGAATKSSSNSFTTPTSTTDKEREREQGGDYLIEICGRYLNIYGQGALRYIDKQWNPAKANDVHTLNFSYINFNNITTVLPRIKARFPHAENFVFRETNISCLGQLNALAELQGISSLLIDSEGNAITTKDTWRQYAIFRLSHWGLKQLNGVEVTETAVQQANELYEGLSELVLWSLPEVMLQPLLARLRLDETCIASKMSPKEWLMKADNKSLRQVVGKEALQWKKLTNNNQLNQQASICEASAANVPSTSSSSATSILAANATLSMRERGKTHFASMLENTCNAVEKLHKVETLWPSLLLDIVRNTLLDYSQMDVYLQSILSEIMK